MEGIDQQVVEIRKRLCVRHGCTPNPRSQRTRARYWRSSIVNNRPKRSSSSAFHCSSTRAARDHDRLRTLSQQQRAGDESSLNRLAKSGVIGDEEMHPREAQGLDPSPKRRRWCLSRAAGLPVRARAACRARSGPRPRSCGSPEADLAAGQRLVPGIYLGTPPPARQPP